jgi:hypothetical protein
MSGNDCASNGQHTNARYMGKTSAEADIIVGFKATLTVTVFSKCSIMLRAT